VYAGEYTVNEKLCYGLDFSGEFRGKKVSQQIWISKDDQSIIKYVIKTPQGVLCTPVSMFRAEMILQSETPKKYKPKLIEKLKYRIGTFNCNNMMRFSRCLH